MLKLIVFFFFGFWLYGFISCFILTPKPNLLTFNGSVCHKTGQSIQTSSPQGNNRSPGSNVPRSNVI